MVRIALIAHDAEKSNIIRLVQEYEALLSNCCLFGTHNTSELIMSETGLAVEQKKSGPLGGDVQIAAEVATDCVDAIVFLTDTVTSHPHEPDISALIRLCEVYDVPLATDYHRADGLLNMLATKTQSDERIEGSV